MKTVVIYYENDTSSAYIEKMVKAGISLSGKYPFEIWKMGTFSNNTKKNDFCDNPHVYIKLPDVPEEDPVGIMSEAMTKVYEKERPDIMIFPDDNMGNILAGKISKKNHRLAALHLSGCYMDEDGCFHGRSLSYNGNLTASIIYREPPLAITILDSASDWDEINIKEGMHFPSPEKTVCYDFSQKRLSSDMRIISRQEIAQKSDLTNGKTVFICGRGVGKKEIAKIIQKLAKKTNALVGGSRPAVIDGLAHLDALVGISGKMIAPKLCVLWGVSGSGAFMAGVKNSKCIVAINHDEDAPVFKQSDYGVVADCEEMALEMHSLLPKNK